MTDAKFVGTAKVQLEPVNLSKLEIEHAALQEECDRWKALVVIGCEEDEDVKRMARPFLTDLEIDGDKYGVPGTVGIVEALCKKLKSERALRETMCRDICEDEEKIKALARPFLSEFEINGDRGGVPGSVEIVEALCNKLKTTGDNLIEIAESTIKLGEELAQSGEITITPELKSLTDGLKQVLAIAKEKQKRITSASPAS